MSRDGHKVSMYIYLGDQLVFMLYENYLLWDFSYFVFTRVQTHKRMVFSFKLIIIRSLYFKSHHSGC